MFDCSAEIYVYYAHPDDKRADDSADGACSGCNSNVVLPILEIDMPLPGEGEEGEEGGGSNSEDAPGFTTALMLTSMMAAAIVLIPKRKEE